MQLGPSTVSKWHPKGLFKKSAQIDLRAKRQEREGRREGGRKVGVRYRQRRAFVSHCVWVQERDRQNERTVHTFPRRNLHCLPPPTGRQGVKTGSERERVFINHTLALSPSPSSPPLPPFVCISLHRAQLRGMHGGCCGVISPAWSSSWDQTRRAHVPHSGEQAS